MAHHFDACRVRGEKARISEMIVNNAATGQHSKRVAHSPISSKLAKNGTEEVCKIRGELARRKAWVFVEKDG